jgi:hypothetical protein
MIYHNTGNILNRGLSAYKEMKKKNTVNGQIVLKFFLLFVFHGQ